MGWDGQTQKYKTRRDEFLSDRTLKYFNELTENGMSEFFTDGIIHC